MTGAEVLSRLSRRGLFRIKPGLERMRALMRSLGDPQDRYPSVHIAGTNGKGSVAAGLEAVLRCAGFKTGLYISPHLGNLRERIQINREPIHSQAFEAAAKVVAQAEERTHLKLTYFEFLTAMAFSAFRAAGIDIGIVEVGLGGVWDATNVLRSPEVSIITSIGMDHWQWLGRTPEAIAVQKAGIIKPNGIVVSGAQGAAMKAVAAVARRQNASLWQLGSDFLAQRTHSAWMDNYQTGQYKAKGEQTLRFTLRLLGKHQIDNASLVISAVRRLRSKGWKITDKQIDAGLSILDWPGRFFINRAVGHAPILFDGAHNPDAMRAFLKTLQESPWNRTPKTLVFSAYSDKDYEGMARLLKDLPRRIFLCRLPGTRGLSTSLLAKAFIAAKAPLEMIESPETALRRAIAVTPDDQLIVVTGSLALVGKLLSPPPSNHLNPHAHLRPQGGKVLQPAYV